MHSQPPPFGYLRRALPAANGARMHVCELGSGTGAPPLLLLHGLHDSHQTWKHVAPALAQDRRVLMPDLFGCGMSDRPDASYDLTWHATTVAQCMRALDVHEVDVAGHSFGGGVGQMLLLQPGLRVRRLALLASGGLGRDITFWLRLAGSPVVEHLGQPFMAHGTRLALRLLHPTRSADDVERLSEMNAREHTARAFARTVRDVVDWRGQRKAFAQHAHQIRDLPPLAVCWGDDDTLIPITHAIDFAQSVPGVRLCCVKDAGHWVHHDRPDQVVELLRSFLEPAQAAPLAA